MQHRRDAGRFKCKPLRKQKRTVLAWEQLISGGMRFIPRRITGRAAIFCCALTIVFVAMPNAEARRVRYRKPTPISVVLQPFRLARSVVHRAPRILAATAVAPIKVAFYSPRKVKPRMPRGVAEIYEADEDSDPKPIRAAYSTSGRSQTAPPRAEEFNEDQDESGRVEQRGDRPMVSGRRAVLRNGVAYAPSEAPQSVKNAIWATNSLRRKPYVWGGGHGSFYDRGYDCSGTVSFALHNAGALNSPLPSSDLMRFGERGRGRWMTIYSRSGHTFAVIAGLRLDTTDLGRGGDVGPRWYAYGRDTGGYVARHPVGM
jgi:cell wall-associated NlpC family hydrolase